MRPTYISDMMLRHRVSIDALVVSGGEPLLQSGAVHEMASSARRFKLDVGVHTNGVLSKKLNQLIAFGRLDAVMLDVKSPFRVDAFMKATGCLNERVATTYLDGVRETARLCSERRRRGPLKYFEVRTTVYPGISDTEAEIREIASKLGTCDAYVIQQGRPELASDPLLRRLEPVSYQTLTELGKAAAEACFSPVKIRAVGQGERPAEPNHIGKVKIKGAT